MSKQELLRAKLPDEYEDCSNWFLEGMDNVPQWIDFVRAGKSKKEYEKFCLLESIENMKRHLREITDEFECAEIQRLIDEEIEKYNNCAGATK